jgi:hypothetical protein
MCGSIGLRQQLPCWNNGSGANSSSASQHRSNLLLVLVFIYTIKRQVFWGLSHGVTVALPAPFRPPTSVLCRSTQISAMAHPASSLSRTTRGLCICHSAAVVCWGAPPVYPIVTNSRDHDDTMTFSHVSEPPSHFHLRPQRARGPFCYQLDAPSHCISTWTHFCQPLEYSQGNKGCLTFKLWSPSACFAHRECKFPSQSHLKTSLMNEGGLGYRHSRQWSTNFIHLPFFGSKFHNSIHPQGKRQKTPKQ